MSPRLTLAQLPTPLQPLDRLSTAWGGPRIWCKRDDLTGFGISGNKIRKLEYHLAAALEHDASVIVTSGAIQSNHCRATALACAQLGLECHLVIRTDDGLPPQTAQGNHLLHRLSGATIHYVDPAGYRSRNAIMTGIADDMTAGRDAAWVIPEGASDYLGAQSFLAAGQELADQLPPAETKWGLWHAASSGGTTAGLIWSAEEHQFTVLACSIGDSRHEFASRLADIGAENTSLPTLSESRNFSFYDEYIGGGYGVVRPAEVDTQIEATRLTGLLFDPVYTGKAIHGLKQAISSGRLEEFDNVVFWHTGGGFGVFAHDLGL